ncbi:hypothetical protein Salmuc_00297 [Salipiger mucosus DSM 16094]|uniref:Uncharacterized protein n=1 Tax=Salipiger mucosus DSM 16094 TaxID=1123237 RepID=S9QQR6_9RHOB|nr:hypothetical protein Salmuc_00297 [Salipiger mucosus DSM 16094]
MRGRGKGQTTHAVWRRNPDRNDCQPIRFFSASPHKVSGQADKIAFHGYTALTTGRPSGGS